MMSYWVTWPPRHKLRVAQSGYKAPMRRRKMKRGADYRTPVEMIVQGRSGVVPFKNLPGYVQKDLLEYAKRNPDRVGG